MLTKKMTGQSKKDFAEHHKPCDACRSSKRLKSMYCETKDENLITRVHRKSLLRKSFDIQYIVHYTVFVSNTLYE